MTAKGQAARLATLWAVLTGLRWLAALPITEPRIFRDELVHWRLARAIAFDHPFLMSGQQVDYPAVLYPALLSAAFHLGDTRTVFHVAQGLNAAFVSAVIFSAYALAREFSGPAAALLAAALAGLAPGGVYSALIMEENLYYPLFVLSCWLCFRVLSGGTVRDAIACALALCLTYFAKPLALPLVLAYTLTVIVWAAVELRGRVGSRVGIAALAVRLTPAVVCGVALLMRNALARRGQAPGAPSDLLLSRFYADELSGPLVPPLVPLAAVVVALVVALTLGTGVAPVASALRAWKSASGDRRRMWFAVFTVLAVAVYVLAAARHTMVLNVAPKIHERYLFAVGPLLLALFVAKDSPAPGAVTAAVVVTAIVLVVGPLGHIALTSRTWVDAPSLTVPWQMRRMLGGGKVAALVLGSVALLVCAGVRRARGNGLRGFGWLAALLVLLNAGWYGTMYRHPWLDPVARLVRGVQERLGPTGRVTLVVRDDAEALRLVSQYTKFWLDDRATVYWAGEGRAPWYADVSGPATEAARRTSASYLVAAPGSAALCPGARTVSDLGAGPTLAVEVLQIPPGGCGTE